MKFPMYSFLGDFSIHAVLKNVFLWLACREERKKREIRQSKREKQREREKERPKKKKKSFSLNNKKIGTSLLLNLLLLNHYHLSRCILLGIHTNN